MTPHFPKPRFLAKFHLGMGGDILFFQKWHLALDPGPGPTRTTDRPNLDQAWGPTWTRHMPLPGPGMGLNLDQAQGPTWTRQGPTWTRHGAQPGPSWAHLGHRRPQPEPGTAQPGLCGPTRALHGPTWASDGAHLGPGRGPPGLPEGSMPCAKVGQT